VLDWPQNLPLIALIQPSRPYGIERGTLWWLTM